MFWDSGDQLRSEKFIYPPSNILNKNWKKKTCQNEQYHGVLSCCYYYYYYYMCAYYVGEKAYFHTAVCI